MNKKRVREELDNLVKIAKDQDNKLNINLVECDINISSIDEFESVFVTNSLMGIMPVTNIEKNNYNKENKLIKILKENL